MPSNDDEAAGAAAPEALDCTAVSAAPVAICGMPPWSRSFLSLIAFPWSLSFKDARGAETSFLVDWITVAPVSTGVAAAVAPGDATARRRTTATMAVTLRMCPFSFTCGSTHPDAESPLAPVSYTHLRAHETRHDLVCRLLLENKKSNVSTLTTYARHNLITGYEVWFYGVD